MCQTIIYRNFTVQLQETIIYYPDLDDWLFFLKSLSKIMYT